MIDLASIMGMLGGGGGAAPAGGGSPAAGAASALGGIMGATPYGAAFNAASGVLQSAMEDKPSNTSSGAGQFQNGGLTVGVKNVGKGSVSGGTSASQSASQTQPGEPGSAPGSASAKSNTVLLVSIGAGTLLILGGMFVLTRKR